MSQIKTTVAAFHQWAKPALKTASTDDGLPVLTAAQIEITPTYALMITTDRFAASVSRLRYERNGVRGVTVLLYAGDLQRALQVFRNRKDAPELTIKATAQRVTFASGGTEMTLTTLAGEAEARSKETKKPHTPPEFPNIKRLVADALATPADVAFSGPMAFRFDYLARLASAAPKWEPTIIQQAAGGPARPYLIRMGDDFLGLLMPRRFLAEDGTGMPPLDLIGKGWHDALGNTADDSKEKSA